MYKKFMELTNIKLIAFTGISLILLFLLSSTYLFISESIAYNTGTLKEITLTPEDFYLEALKYLDEETYISTDNDPQMILETPLKLSRITLEMKYNMFPGEMVVYYTVKEGQGFSDRKRFWFTPVENKQNVFQADMIMKDVLSIRIDPTTVAGNRLNIEKIVLNEQKTLGYYFKINYSDIYNLIIFTPLIAAILRLIQEMFKKRDNIKV